MNAASNPDCLNNGLSKACFQSSGKCAVVGDVFIMIITIGSNLSQQLTRSEVGMGSRVQVVLADL